MSSLEAGAVVVLGVVLRVVLLVVESDVGLDQLEVVEG